MAVTQISDVVVPEEFTQYTIENTAVKSALVQSSVLVRNGAIETQLKAGAESFTIPDWADLADDEADIVSDASDTDATPRKISAAKQMVRKSFLHAGWSAMNLASELAGSDALTRIQDRAAAYWTRQLQKRLINSLSGIIGDNTANDSSDMVSDIHGATNADITDATKFSAAAVINAAGTLGDSLQDIAAIAMHSDVYRAALTNDLITTIPDSKGGWIQTFRGLAVVIDDGLPYTAAGGALSTDTAPKYTTVLFGNGAIAYGLTTPAVAKGTEIENKPSAGNGGGQEILHSRVNVAIHPLGYSWVETSVAGDAPTLAELATATNWNRVFERKQIPLAFLVTNG